MTPDTSFWKTAQHKAIAAAKSPARAEHLLDEAEHFAAHASDAYQRTAVLAWPIAAALHLADAERARARYDRAKPFLARARRLFARALAQLPAVTPAASRAHALELLLHAAFPLGEDARDRCLAELLALHRAEKHWRIERAARDAAALLAPHHPDLVARRLDALNDPRLAARIARRRARYPTFAPRPFIF